MNPKPAEFPAFDRESHRGGRGVMPENTIPSMLYSLSIDGITTLEMDVKVTADGKLVLSHDDYLNPWFTRKPNGEDLREEEKENYPIMQMTYDELKQYDVGLKAHHLFPSQRKMAVSIPLLEDVIDSVQCFIEKKGRAQVFYNIETKSSVSGDNTLNPTPEVFVQLLMDVITRKGIMPYVIIQSADVRTLQVLKENYPYIRTSYLVGSRRKDFTLEDNLELLGFEPDIYSPNFKYLTREEVDKCHERGMKVVAWTPNTKEEIDMLKLMGVDGIITDYPELLVE
ncbi:glycerophosphodiester phosphodiesterase family protein [Sinomicrobium soli]|uniref:glycerophosphodiester phosphodiesterase family protein n=1 Tax=Sinomicrobium sp. N-1-3-6 TaxID=2219864 RepID=UPI000DCB189C|nr:glycerophosphodiester phosphodiesterase family protein [Sinomicrobium sp. N-1-3-6]RAV30294.1 glycerophosphodiester phosphodiesterase [Sinomicrobium sp. N-1-3-6]